MMSAQVATKSPARPRIRAVGLNAISPSMFTPQGRYILNVVPTTDINELRDIFNKYTLEVMVDLKDVTWVHYIRHKPTLDVLRMVFPEFPEQPVGTTYRYAPGDVLIVATLKHGSRVANPSAGPDVVVNADDLVYWLVAVKHVTEVDMYKRRPESLVEELLRRF